VIGRVWNAYRAELEKLLHRSIGYAAFGAALAGVLLAVGVQRLGEAATRLQAGEKAVAATNGYIVLSQALSYGVTLGAIVLVIFAGLSVAEETELGTAKILFSKPVKRTEVVLAKGLLLLSLSVALVAFVAATGGALAGALYGFGDIVDPSVNWTYHEASEMAGHVARAIPLMVPPLFGILMLAFVMSAIADQSGIAVGFAFGTLFACVLGTWLFDRAAPWLVTSYVTFPTDTLRSLGAGENTAQWGVTWGKWQRGPTIERLGLAVSAATALAAWGVAAIWVARRPILVLALSAGIAGALLAGPGAGTALASGSGDRFKFAIQDLEVPGQVWSVSAVDVDRDGKKDLVVFHVIGRRGNDPHRFLSIFYQTASGFKPKPDQTIEVPPGACCRFVADVDPASPGLEIGFIGTRGAFCFTARNRVFDPSRPKRLFDDESFFDIAPGTQLPDWDPLVKDVDGDGRPDILFPRKGSFALYRQWPDGAFTRAAELSVEYSQHFGTAIETLLLNRFINYRAGLSKPALADIDGSRKLDVVTYRDNALEVFLQKPGTAALFGRDPDKKMSIKMLTETGAEAGGGGDDSYNSVNAEFADVDGDGLADVVLYRNVGKVGLFESMRTQVLFYRARPGTGWNADKPDQVVNLKGLSINPALIDVDKDGAKDLVVSSLRTDLVTNAKRALFSSVTITYYVFRYDKKAKKFHDAPDYSHDLSIDVSRIEGGGTIPVANFSGDYDGDGYPDLLSLERPDEVRILPGKVESGFFSGEKLDYDEGEEAKIPIETSNSIVIDDLNKDGKSDFLFWYFDPNWETKERGTIKVALSQ
jgi:hypothetical protein